MDSQNVSINCVSLYSKNNDKPNETQVITHKWLLWILGWKHQFDQSEMEETQKLTDFKLKYPQQKSCSFCFVFFPGWMLQSLWSPTTNSVSSRQNIAPFHWFLTLAYAPSVSSISLGFPFSLLGLRPGALREYVLGLLLWQVDWDEPYCCRLEVSCF